MSRTFDITKRLFDLLIAAVVAVILLPVLIVIYLHVVTFGGQGRGFFVQTRVGRNGRLFPLIKFRTMRADHVHDPDPSIVITDADRDVTPIGRFLRRTKLDELPQIFNVLAGHMSLVGPRPTVPEQVAAYDDFKRQRLAVRPGVTSLAIVEGGNALSWDERIEWDVYYVHHRYWRMDLSILAATVGRLLAVSTEKRVRRFKDVHPGETP